jgi:putative ABC transport system permease protein
VTASPRIKFGVLLDYMGKNKPIIGVGIDPLKEEKILGLSKKMVAGRVVNIGAREVNIGARFAKELGLKIGDTFTVITQTSGGSLSGMNLKVVGIFSLGAASIDGRTFFLPLDKAQELLDLEGKATEIIVILKDPGESRAFAAAAQKMIPKGLTARPWQDNGVLYFYIAIARYIYMGIYALILILASFTILNAMFMAVMERKREIGMMKAMGMKAREVVRMIVLEALLLGIGASLAGAAAGAGLSWYISTAGVDYTAVFEKMGNTEIPLSYVYRGLFDWNFILTGFLLGIFFTVLAAFAPARRAARLDPADAMREN